MTSVVVIGDGAVGSALADELAAAQGVRLVQHWARRTRRPHDLAPADLYVLAVSDAAVAEMSGALPFPAGAVVAHTAGSVDMRALSEGIAHRAVFYPLQTFTRGRSLENFRAIPFFIEGETPHALSTVRAAAEAIADNVAEMSSERRARLHLAAIFVNNFTNAMLSLAEEIAADADENFDVLRPLFAETAAKALSLPSPRAAQTGPALRGDRATQVRHEAMLADSHPHLTQLYKEMSDLIWKSASRTGGLLKTRVSPNPINAEESFKNGKF